MSAAPERPGRRHWLSPSYWGFATGIGLLRLCARLPLRRQQAIGRWLGRQFVRVARRRCRIADINLGLCFPTLDARQREALLRAQFESLGMGVFETAAASVPA